MNNLQPTHTKARIYLQNADTERLSPRIAPFIMKIKDGVSAVAEFKTADQTTLLKVIALKDVIHKSVVPAIEEFLPDVFVTLEAVCAFKTLDNTKHRLYRERENEDSSTGRGAQLLCNPPKDCTY